MSPVAEAAARNSERVHAGDLGATLRTVLVAPRRGFQGAIALADRRARLGHRAPEGLASYTLSVVGGASLMLLWLKLGSMIGQRDVARASFRWDFLIAAMVAGAALVLIAQALWGLVGRWIARFFGAETSSRDLRLVWGASFFPQVIALLFLFPLDLLIVGPDAFTSEKLTDPLSLTWSAFSVAAAICLALWSLFLLVRGVEVSTSQKLWESLLTSFVGIATLAAAVGVFVVLGLLLGGSS